MNTSKFGPVQIGIILLTAATAIIHLVLAYSIAVQLGLPNSLMFVANGLGYLALVAALYLPQFKKWHNWVRWALMAFTAVTIVGWVAIGSRNLIGYTDKLIEVALIALLFTESRKKA
ncbi:MAG: hypothetical protein AB1894_00760 [Chloroflexota bacterium]